MMTGTESYPEDSTVFYPVSLHCSQTPTHPERIVSDASFETYDIAFGFKFTSGDYNLALGAGTLLYNMALNDQYAFFCSGQSRFITRAAGLYKKAIQIMLSQDVLQDQDSGICLFLLSLCNNLGFCCAYLFDENSKKTCQEHLDHILSDPDSTCQLTLEQFEFFHLTSLVAGWNTKPAAAA